MRLHHQPQPPEDPQPDADPTQDSDEAVPEDPQPDADKPVRKHRVRRIVLLGAIIGICLLLVACLIDVIVLMQRVERVAIPPTRLAAADAGQTWVIVGSDNRSDVSEEWVDIYGTGAASAPSDHADVVLVIHRDSKGTHAFAVPRDMWVKPKQGGANRLTLMLAVSPDAFVSSLCLSLGIPGDHLVVVRMGALMGAVDAVGGIDITFPHPTRDAVSLLDVPAGVVHLDGDQALQYIRSRRPEYFIDGQWQRTDKVQGALDRPKAAVDVLQKVAGKLRRTANPLTWQSLAWVVSGSIGLDSGTSLLDLVSLIDAADSSFPVLPVSNTSGVTLMMPSAETYAALEAAGYPSGACQV